MAGRPSASRPSGGRTHEVRVIGGQYKRSRLPVADRPGLRPTPDRVRETLFNWLGQDLTGWRCVDAFAGTGALGLEAASRGAAEVVLVEQDAALLARLNQLKARLQDAQALRIERGDKRTLDLRFVQQREALVTRGWRRLRELAGTEIPVIDYPLPIDSD